MRKQWRSGETRNDPLWVLLSFFFFFFPLFGGFETAKAKTRSREFCSHILTVPPHVTPPKTFKALVLSLALQIQADRKWEIPLEPLAPETVS